MVKECTVAVDFDGTCVTYAFPGVGEDIGAVPVLRELCSKGHKIILHTMRGEHFLPPAVQWFKDNDIPLYGINDNPSQHSWTDSGKVFAHVYIDDAALGAPVKRSAVSPYPYIDWDLVRQWLVDHDFL
jgi:hypothetical protein